jgi:hypothetical protein
MGMILLNPFLPVQTTAWFMRHVISWAYYISEANFDLWGDGKNFPPLQRSNKASRTKTQFAVKKLDDLKTLRLLLHYV